MVVSTLNWLLLVLCMNLHGYLNLLGVSLILLEEQTLMVKQVIGDLGQYLDLVILMDGRISSVEKATQDHIALWHYTGRFKDNANAFDVPIDAIAASIGIFSRQDPANQKGYTQKAYIVSMVKILKQMGYDPYKSKSGAPTARPNSGNPQASPVSPKNPPNTNLSSRIQIGGDGAPISSGYGYRTDPVTGQVNKLHGGIDIAVPSGTFISLTEPGVVVAAGQYGGYGNLVDIWVPGKGIQLRFAHLSQILTRTGAKVNAYTAIGRSGGGANDKGRGSSQDHIFTLKRILKKVLQDMVDLVIQTYTV